MLFHKSILINIKKDIANWEKKTYELSAIFQTFSDIEFYLIIDKDEIKKYKEKFGYFNNIKIIYKSIDLIENFDHHKTDKIDIDLLDSNLINGFEITNGCYWLKQQIVTAESVIKNVVSNNKKIIYYIGETFNTFKKHNNLNDLLTKLYNDLADLKVKRDLIFVYRPQFDEQLKNKTVTNQHIDEVIQLIQCFCMNYFKQIYPVIFGYEVNNENVLSYCVTNNLDGFLYEWNGQNIDKLIDFINKVYGWQRIIINLARRKLL